MPEGKVHLELRTFLYALLKYAFGAEACIGSEQFVYWNARDPRRKLAPDAFVRLGVPDATFGAWKTWERGTPELAVEIVSPSEDEWLDWEEKFERYHEAGVQELVRFDPEAPSGSRLRVWDRLEEDLVEREVTGDTTPCRTLGFHWVVAPVPGHAVGLRLARDREGKDLVLAEVEAVDRARQVAEQRVRELEDELRRRDGA